MRSVRTLSHCRTSAHQRAVAGVFVSKASLSPRQRRLQAKQRKWEADKAASTLTAAPGKSVQVHDASLPVPVTGAPSQHLPVQCSAQALATSNAPGPCSSSNSSQAVQHIQPHVTTVLTGQDSLGSMSGQQLAATALEWAAQVRQLTQSCLHSSIDCSSLPGTAQWWHALPAAQQQCAAINFLTLGRTALAHLPTLPLPACHSSGAAPSDAPTQPLGSSPSYNSHGTSAPPPAAVSPSLTRQQHADITWALDHLRGTDSAVQHVADQLQAAMQVPFRVLPLCLPGLSLGQLGREVHVNRDTIQLTGPDGAIKVVPEQRLTGWQSDVGATFCYSGKEMQPVPAGALTPTVAAVRDRLQSELGGVRYDSVLINLYEDGRCGMRFHADPLYGCWTSDTAVVSVGSSRDFAFRSTSDPSVRWHYQVHNGDVVHMYGDCQEHLQHSVVIQKRPRHAQGGRDDVVAGVSDLAGPRMSLVYKQRLPGTL